MKIEKLLKNKFLYYAALGLAALNVLGYVTQGSMPCILAFGVTYYCAHSYTKNRTLDIFAGLFVANILFGCGRVKEGMENKENKKNKENKECKGLNDKTCKKNKNCKWNEAVKAVKAVCVSK